LPGGLLKNSARLQAELLAAGNGLVTKLNSVSTSGDDLNLVFEGTLASGEITALDGGTGQPYSTHPAGGLLAAHNDSPPASGEPKQTGEGVMLVAPQPQSIGLELCDRDILLKTAIVGADSFEDLKANLTTFVRESWGETSLVGCYKWNGTAYVACADQADADTNAVLSIWDYQAKHQTTQALVKYDVRGGGVSVDSTTPVTENTQIYAVAAPGIPASSGGGVRLFDGYLHFFAGDDVLVESPAARSLDPALATAASVLRIFMYYQAGAKRSHVLRLITYRPSGSF
jgi:hypothetical protein